MIALLEILQAAAQLITTVAPLVDQGKAVLAEEDVNLIEVNYLRVKLATQTLRQEVDATLAAASKR